MRTRNARYKLLVMLIWASVAIAQSLATPGSNAKATCPTTVADTKLPAPTIDKIKEGATKVSGKVAIGSEGKVQLCNGNVALGDAVSPESDGSFTVSNLPPIKNGKKVQAQFMSSAGSAGPVSGDKTAQSDPVVIVIGGVEYSAYSAQSQTTNGFLNIFYQGPYTGRFSGWGRIRLTSTPQQATNGIVSVISNPTGLTTNSYSNVGQAFDYVLGPSVRLATNWSFIAGLGATTPLSSQDTPITFVAPAPGTTECTELVNRFSSANGYTPSLSLNTAANPSTCLAGGYTNLAFSNQDRSSFLLKYGAGFRTTYPFKFADCKGGTVNNCAPADAALDITFGQDASVTRGYLRGVVLKLDGMLPLPTGNSSWLYLFGSAYMRLRKNVDLPPLLLQTPNPPITVPAATVIVLPLKLPDRDYYRLGVGINVNQLWCKTFGSNCSKDSQGNAGQ
jgi:hypothetical protein